MRECSRGRESRASRDTTSFDGDSTVGALHRCASVQSPSKDGDLAHWPDPPPSLAVAGSRRSDSQDRECVQTTSMDEDDQAISGLATSKDVDRSLSGDLAPSLAVGRSTTR